MKDIGFIVLRIDDKEREEYFRIGKPSSYEKAFELMLEYQDDWPECDFAIAIYRD